MTTHTLTWRFLNQRLLSALVLLSLMLVPLGSISPGVDLDDSAALLDLMDQGSS